MKQAFLITAYNHFDHLCRLISFLDDPSVWFYVYIDAKVPIPPLLKSLQTVNPIEILHSQRVEWGDQSQIITELELFAKAFCDKEIEWFHLISGTDFPLLPTKDILQFYEQSDDVDCFMETEPIPTYLADRVEIFHFGLRHPAKIKGWVSIIQSKFRALQLRIGIKRKSPVKGGFMYGSNWVDLRRKAVKMLLEDWDRILRTTRYTQIANEIYKQTFLQNRGLRIINDNLRYIDWSARQPSPKSLGLEDYNAMVTSGKLFARKFDAVDSPLLRDKILALFK